MISSVPYMDSMAVVTWNWPQDSFSVAHRFWLLCHISIQLLTLAMLCNFLSAATLFISKWFSVFVISTAGLLHANNLLVLRASSLWMNMSYMFSPVVFDSLQLKSSHRRETMAFTLTQCCRVENLLRSTVEICILWVYVLLLTWQVGNIQYPKWTAYLHRVKVVIV